MYFDSSVLHNQHTSIKGMFTSPSLFSSSLYFPQAFVGTDRKLPIVIMHCVRHNQFRFYLEMNIS